MKNFSTWLEYTISSIFSGSVLPKQFHILTDEVKRLNIELSEKYLNKVQKNPNAKLTKKGIFSGIIPQENFILCWKIAWISKFSDVCHSINASSDSSNLCLQKSFGRRKHFVIPWSKEVISRNEGKFLKKRIKPKSISRVINCWSYPHLPMLNVC